MSEEHPLKDPDIIDYKQANERLGAELKIRRWNSDIEEIFNFLGGSTKDLPEMPDGLSIDKYDHDSYLNEPVSESETGTGSYRRARFSYTDRRSGAIHNLVLTQERQEPGVWYIALGVREPNGGYRWPLPTVTVEKAIGLEKKNQASYTAIRDVKEMLTSSSQTPNELSQAA